MCHSADSAVHHVSLPLIVVLLFVVAGASSLNVHAEATRQSSLDLSLEGNDMATPKKLLTALFFSASPAAPHVANRMMQPRRPVRIVLQRTSQDRLSCSALLGGNATVGRKPITYISKSAFCICMAFWTGWFDATAFQEFQMYLSAATMRTRQMAGALASKDVIDASRFFTLFAHYLGGHLFFTCLNLKSSNSSCRLAAPVVLGLGILADCARVASENAPNFLTCMQGLVNAAAQQKTGTITFALTGHVHRISGHLAQVLMQGAGIMEVLKSLSTRCVIAFCAGIMASTTLSPFLISNQYLSGIRFSGIAAVYATLMIFHELRRKHSSSEMSPT